MCMCVYVYVRASARACVRVYCFYNGLRIRAIFEPSQVKLPSNCAIMVGVYAQDSMQQYQRCEPSSHGARTGVI